MSTPTRIVDSATGSEAKVDNARALLTVESPRPPDEELVTIPYRAYFTNSAGANDMRVDGSTTPVDFCINADPEFDIYLDTLSFLIADAGATLNDFGNLPALTNGVEFSWITQDFGTTIIHEGLTTNFEFVRLCGGNPPFGDAAGAFRANNVSGVSEGYIPILDFSDMFAMPWGLRLRAGTLDKICFKIQDNVSTIDAFNVVAYGIKVKRGD